MQTSTLTPLGVARPKGGMRVLKRTILVLAMAAILAAMAAMLGGGPAIAAKAGGADFGPPAPGEPHPSCEGIVKAAEKSGKENLKAMTGERGCGPPGPPKV